MTGGGGAGGQGVTPFIDIPTAGNNVGQEVQSGASNNTANASALHSRIKEILDALTQYTTKIC